MVTTHVASWRCAPIDGSLQGEALLCSGRCDRAREQLESVLRLDPEFVPTLVLLAEAWRARGEAEQAKITIEHAHAPPPTGS